jgi:PPP family 3-phenylpropionic acid transporter
LPAVVRLAVYFVALFAGSGASMPFMPVWFRAQGLSATQMAAILAAPYFTQAIAGTALAMGADHFRLRRTAMAVIGAGACLAYLALGLVHGFWGWAIAWFIGFSLMGVLGPLADVITLQASREGGFAYGAPRGFGSLAFLVGNVGAGVVLARSGPGAVLGWTVAAAALASGAALLLPPTPTRQVDRRAKLGDLIGGLSRLVRNPRFMACVLAAGLILAAHGFYNGFSVILWRKQGLGPWAGALWATAVGAEALFIWLLEPWRRRLGPERLLALGGAGAVVRWLALAFAPPLWLLFPLQALHAVSFAATYLASLRLVERLSPQEDASAAQTLSSGVANGALMALTTALSGPLFDRLGAGGYAVMAAIAACGLIIAVRLPRGQLQN